VLAERLNNLGTETAFAVSLAAAEWARRATRIYPFHLGDINLPTPANVVEAMNKAIADGKTGYCAAAGIVAVAHCAGRRRGQSPRASPTVPTTLRSNRAASRSSASSCRS
jgi:aspartate/methionine/tyrosine aminotransferase